LETCDIKEIAGRFFYEGNVLRGKIEETHISWVMLTRQYAFKIKKPLKLSFLDFSTLALRKHFCEKELTLNSRFSEIYQAVMPIRRNGNQWIIGGAEGADVIDYCVVMKRLATAKRMDNMIRSGSIDEGSIVNLSKQVAHFHGTAEKVFDPFDLNHTRKMFNDITSITAFASTKIASQLVAILRKAILQSERFLEDHSERMQQRIDHGLKRDLHGDLHCRNIFLYRKPVLFDCIEFTETYRRIDVLYEIAFLCMDLEAFHKKYLADIFVTEYKKHFPAFQQKEDYSLFLYFKALRANIRAKVQLMQTGQSGDHSSSAHREQEAGRYLTLMNEYLSDLQRY